MKKTFLLLSLLVLISDSVFAQRARVLDRVQEKIDSCFIASFNAPNAYNDLERSLMVGYKSEKSSNIKSYYLYWLSYLTYYKSVSAFKEADLEKEAKKARKQIDDKKYEVELNGKGNGVVKKYGVAFYGKHIKVV